MMRWVIEASARYRWLVVAMYAGLALLAAATLPKIPLDALPDLSDTQVIVFTEWKGRAPSLVEDQVTYPISTALLSTPHVSAVRGYSMMGMSFVHVLFEEGTDPYWARSRVLEFTSGGRVRLPKDATPTLGPDASGVGWVYAYALVDGSGKRSLADLRTLQDFTLRYALESVPGVAQVATVGGYERQYQVRVDPMGLASLGLSFRDVTEAVRRANGEVGGRVLESSGREFFLRSQGYLKSLADVEAVVLATRPDGTVLSLRQVATVAEGGEGRRGLADWGGQGEVVGGIVVMRDGENALRVIQRVKERLAEMHRALPAEVEIRTAYDRSSLIERALATLRRALSEEMVTVGAVIVIFLLHPRSALLPLITLPLAVLLAFLPMAWLQVPATVMSLGGIAIALGATVDAEIVMIEACHKRLEGAPADLNPSERRRLLALAAREVTPALFLSLLMVAISFLPVLGLSGQAGKLFRPLAYTKTFVMVAAGILSVTLAPALRDVVLRGPVPHEDRHPLSVALRKVYEPFVHVALRRPLTTLLIGAFAMLSAIPPWLHLGHEFMPSLLEGDILYMPTTLPNISIEEAKRQLARQDQTLASFPEVETVFGKVGRAETATDPAPLSMVETVVRLKDPSQWPLRKRHRFYSGWAPSWLRPLFQPFWPEQSPETYEELVQKLDGALDQPGWTNGWTMPIRGRIDMLSTGLRTPVGIKIFGPDLASIDATGTALEAAMRRLPGTRGAFYERAAGGSSVEVTPRREALAQVGLAVDDLQEIVASAVGGEEVTTILDGRKRIGVLVRYTQEERASLEAIAQLPVKSPRGSLLTLGDLAEVRRAEVPSMVRNEGGSLVGYLFVDVDPSTDLGGYVETAKKQLGLAEASGALQRSPGVYYRWTGQYEQLELTRERLKVLVPLALMAIVVLLYLQFRNWVEVAIVALSVPFALVGSVWSVHLLGYRISTAVWVGVLALLGLAAQTGVVMIVYIDQAFFRRVREGRIQSLEDIVAAHAEGTVQRLRPKVMTVGTMLMGLVPLLWAQGSGADVMRRIAAPMVGGLVSSAFLTLELIPVIYTYWRYAQLRRAQRRGVSLAVVCGIHPDGDDVLRGSHEAGAPAS